MLVWNSSHSRSTLERSNLEMRWLFSLLKSNKRHTHSTRKMIIISITRINKFSLNTLAVILPKEMAPSRMFWNEQKKCWLNSTRRSSTTNKTIQRRIFCRSSSSSHSMKWVSSQFIFLKWVSRVRFVLSF